VALLGVEVPKNLEDRECMAAPFAARCRSVAQQSETYGLTAALVIMPLDDQKADSDAGILCAPSLPREYSGCRMMLKPGQRVRIVHLGPSSGAICTVVRPLGCPISANAYWTIESEDGLWREVARAHLSTILVPRRYVVRSK